MYKKNSMPKTKLCVRETVEGETIEQKVERVTINKEPITDGANTYYTERSEGVMPAFDPRTDRFEVAIDATDKITKSALAKRQQALDEKREAENPTKPTGESGETPVNSDTSN